MNSENLEEKIENSINQALKLQNHLKELQSQNYIKARIFYEYCPLCKSKNITKSIVGNCREHHLYNLKIPPLMQWMNCENCNHQFIDGYLNDKALDLIFSKTPNYLTVGDNYEENRKISARIIEKVLPFKSNGVWLDIGFGNGLLLFTADEFGFEAIGVDLRKENVQKLKNLGVQAHCDFVQNIQFEKSISVASMMDVLEHIPYPKEVLISLHSKMEKDGYLLISMPNSGSLFWKTLTMNKTNPYYNSIEHCHNFSRTRLFSLLEECGFKAVKYGISERYRFCMEVIAQKK